MRNIISNIKNLWPYLSVRRRKQFGLLLVLMVLTSLFEVVSVGAVLPFLGVLTAPDQVFNHPLMQSLIQILKITESAQLILPITILFVLVVFFAGVVRLILLYLITRLSFATGADLSIDIYRRTLYQEYIIHVSRNSSEIINGIITKTSIVINGVVMPILVLTSSMILLVGIMGVLFLINTSVALTAFVGFGSLYCLVVYYNKRRLKENSQTIAKQSTIMIKTIQEGLGGIRDVLIDGSQEFYCQLYRNADLPLRRASGNNVFIGGSPRYLMEALGMILIASLAYVMSSQNQGIVTVIPILGVFALGAQRLLPTMQQAYSAYSTIKSSDASFTDILDLLNQVLPEYSSQIPSKPLLFKERIILKRISFRYTEDAPWVLKDINLSLKKGACIGIVGVSGGGKSTLVDIIMGLLPPTKGEVIIDNKPLNVKNIRKWQSLIAHVPQSIYLSDGTIEQNIVFGMNKEDIDHQRVKIVSKQAQIASMIEEWPNGYQTVVGEQGVKLSGGQRQRVGIARALYKQSEVLIFDEATSSLDNDTEYKVMKIIEGLSSELTVIIIAHRLTTLKKCDYIIKVDSDKGSQIVDYNKLI